MGFTISSYLTTVSAEVSLFLFSLSFLPFFSPWCLNQALLKKNAQKVCGVHFLSCFCFHIASSTVISHSISKTSSRLPEAIDEKKIRPYVQWVPEGMAFFIEFYLVQSCSSTRAMIIDFGYLYPNALRCQKAECQLPALAAVQFWASAQGIV